MAVRLRAGLGKGDGVLKGVSDFMRRTMGGALDWAYLDRVRALWPGPLVLKGILDRTDAMRAADAGVDGILVSNHGGRQFDSAPTPLAMLPEIKQAVGGRTAVLLDGGVRTGGDILKAIALGAEFVFLGRAFQYGVAALGPRGGDHVVDILADELTNTMKQIGVERFDEISAEMIRRH